MTMTRDKIEELKRLVEKATPGPWNIESTFQTVTDENGKIITGTANLHYVAAANPQTILSLLALAERALEPQTPMDVTVYTLERLREAMTRFGISCGEGGMEHFSVKFESHLLEFIRAATDNLDKLRQAYADLESSKSALEPQGQALPDDGELSLTQLMQVFDMGLGFALCHRDHFSTRDAVKKLQADFKVIQQRVSQLALPAGPVPEELSDDELDDLVRAACFDKLLLQADGSYIIAPHELRSLLSDFAPSPAVAQPVADEREGGT